MCLGAQSRSMDCIVHQAPPSMGFSRQEYWSGVPFAFSALSARVLINLAFV